MSAPVEIPKYTKADFESDQDVRWCPGCGDYAILSTVQKALSTLPVRKENHVFVSGIGCSSRFPYYVSTYGFHTIHGRAPAIASGLKASRPDLTVWVVTGDGDALSIGGNHLIHALRRNFDLKILMFNNRIYGLTKGQYSPTSELGKKTKSTPLGSLDYPFNPLALALGAGASFVARSMDTDAKHLGDIVTTAWKHKGTSFVEIFQNCNIFNDGAFTSFTEKPVRDDKQLRVEHGQKLVFAKGTKGIVRRNDRLVVGNLGQDATLDDVLTHDATDPDPSHAFALAALDVPEFPVAMGVLRAVERPTYEEMMSEQIAQARARKPADLHKLLHAGYTWTVK